MPETKTEAERHIGKFENLTSTAPAIVCCNRRAAGAAAPRPAAAVLRSRCHLFEHLVGAMQPVLSRARRMLTAEDPVNLQALEEAANQVEQDEVVVETYLDADAHAVQEEPPAVSLEMIDALSLLGGDLGLAAKRVDDEDVYLISGVGTKKLIVATSSDGLESDRVAIRLCPMQPFVRDLVESVQRPGKRATGG